MRSERCSYCFMIRLSWVVSASLAPLLIRPPKANWGILNSVEGHVEAVKAANIISPSIFLQNKDFVYRGAEWEKISTFTQRLASEFPHAQVLTSNSREPDNSLKCEDGQFVQICCVKPVQPQSCQSLLNHPMEGYDMPEKIRKFHQVNNVDNFQYDRPYHKGNKDRDNEFKVQFIFYLTCNLAWA